MAPTSDRPDSRRRVATVGTFDGLHRGHQRVLSLVKEEAAARGMEPMVICFDRHPLETIAPERAPYLIQSPSERTNALFREGLAIHTLEFTHALASLTAGEWLEKMHREQRVDVLVVGYDNTFGCDGTRMNISDYKSLGKETGVEVLEASYEPHAASSAIRKLIAKGEIEEAAALLGRPFSITGEVVGGKHLGSSIGFPTANIRPNYKALLPLKGVYEAEALVPDEGFMKAVANIGTQPTVAEDAPLRMEVHIPGFEGDLYGSRITVKFLRRLRDEMKFESIDALKRQIALDIESLHEKR